MIKVERSQTAPASLAAQRSHGGDDVRAALNEDFFGKCAWCEGHHGGVFDVDHLRPQVDHAALRFDWANLLPACNQTCNQRRSKTWPEDGLLDCTVDAVAERLDQRFDPTVLNPQSLTVSVTARLPNDPAAANTADLINKIFDASRQGTTKRRDLYNAWAQVTGALSQAVCGKDEQARLAGLQGLKLLLAPSGAFSGLLRQRVTDELPAALELDNLF